MKKIKVLSIVAACVAAFAFNSCNTGGDSNGYQQLTPAEKSVCFQQTAGSRMTKVAYYSDEHVTTVQEEKEYVDTLDVNTRLMSNGKDTVFTVYNFPVKVIARYIPESAETNALKEALKNYQSPVSVQSKIYYYYTNPITFLLYPETIVLNMNYGGADHKLKIYFSSGNYYTYGQIHATTKKEEAYLLLYGYEIDPKDDTKPSAKQFSFQMGGKSMSAVQIKFFEP